MKIYTRTGDDGSTGLIGGARVSKAELRLECYGTVDELNSAIGLAAREVANVQQPKVHRIQNDLFVIGSQLATPDESPHKSALPQITEVMVRTLEQEIDEADAVLPPLRQFILPGGSEGAARLHLARTICRRAERLLVAFAREQALPERALVYLNRLSDWLFVQARLCNGLQQVSDIVWSSGARQDR